MLLTFLREFYFNTFGRLARRLETGIITEYRPSDPWG
jgi:hypothetical protein